MVARLAASDDRSTTARNNCYMYDCAGTSAWVATVATVRETMRQQQDKMSEEEMRTALEDRALLTAEGLVTTDITNHINLACME